MKNLKFLFLTIILTIGFIFPSCKDDPFNCGCPAPTFFDTEGLEISTYRDFENSEKITAADSVSLAELDMIYIDYLVTYHTSITSQNDWSFSLMNTANACSCDISVRGTDSEELSSLSIITLNDFDADHLANSNINDLFDYYGCDYYGEGILPTYIVNDTARPLTDYLATQNMRNLECEDIGIRLTKAPELNPEFKIKVILEFTSGEVHEVESEGIFVML